MEKEIVCIGRMWKERIGEIGVGVRVGVGVRIGVRVGVGGVITGVNFESML